MNSSSAISPAIVIDIIMIVVIVISVFHYARKGFIAGLINLVGNLVALALAWIVSGKLSPAVFENFFKSGVLNPVKLLGRHGPKRYSSICL